MILKLEKCLPYHFNTLQMRQFVNFELSTICNFAITQSIKELKTLEFSVRSRVVYYGKRMMS